MKRKRTPYLAAKSDVTQAWEYKYFSDLLEEFPGTTYRALSELIQMDRCNFQRKLKQLKLGTYALKQKKSA